MRFLLLLSLLLNILNSEVVKVDEKTDVEVTEVKSTEQNYMADLLVIFHMVVKAIYEQLMDNPNT